MIGMKTIASICAGVALGSFLLAGPSFAENEWQKNHQGRVETNHRLRHQNRRIDKGLKHGQLTSGEAQQLHNEDQSIHNQELQDAAGNHGHLTKAERKQLNQEENAESRQIHEERHDGH
jgi:hypothetical protein